MTTSRALIEARSRAFANTREFFANRSILEVDCPLLSPRASMDEHIDLVEAHVCGEKRFLHSSPEYGMKRLLAQGSGDIYQLSHVFRDGELGDKHNPEFTLLEWYRLGFSFEQMIQETLELLTLFAGPRPCQILRYEDALRHYAQVEIDGDLLAALKKCNVEPSSEFQDRDTLLHLVVATLVEPMLEKDIYTVITHYPEEQAALAKVCPEGALRFEVYTGGLELANGYEELSDKKEIQSRFLAANEDLPMDTLFLDAVEKMPPCSGVAVGFDRLLMLEQGASSINDILPFSWSEA